MTRRTGAQKPKSDRMPSVNVNDGKARIIITVDAETGQLISVGRYLLNAKMAMSIYLQAGATIRVEELNNEAAQWDAMNNQLAIVMAKLEAVSVQPVLTTENPEE